MSDETLLQIERLLASSDAVAVDKTGYASAVGIVFSGGDFTKRAKELCDLLSDLRESAIRKREKAQKTAQEWSQGQTPSTARTNDAMSAQEHVDSIFEDLQRMANFNGFWNPESGARR